MRKASIWAVVIGVLIVGVLIVLVELRIQWPFPWHPGRVPPDTVNACVWVVKPGTAPSGKCEQHCDPSKYGGDPFNLGGTAAQTTYGCCPKGYSLARSDSSWVCKLNK